MSELRTLLREAVAQCLLPGDDSSPVVFLSGGLDSSLVAALLVEHGVRPACLTLDFGAPFDAEIEFATRVARHLDLPLIRVPAGFRQIRGALGATAHALEHPFGDAVTVALYLLGKAARDHGTVIWNGEGGDQLFGGWTNKPMLAATLYGRGRNEPEFLAAYLETFHRFHALEDRLYTSAARNATQSFPERCWIQDAFALPDVLAATLLHPLRAANLRLKGAQNIIPRMHQLAGTHGLSVRAPLFDNDLATWTFTRPAGEFLNNACEKWLLKQVAETYLPPEIVWREKRGMGVPVTEWCLGPLRRVIGRTLRAGRLQADGWFSPTFVARLRHGDDPTVARYRRRRVGEKLWTLFYLHLWHDVRGLALPALEETN